MRDKRDTRKKRFIDALTAHGTVFHAAQAAGVSRNTVYRWRQEDFEFAEAWYEAHENAVDAVENTIYQQAVGGNALANRECYQRHNDRSMHVGFSSVLVPSH